MTTLIGLSGSLRHASYNSALLRACAELAPDGVRVEIVPIRDIPLYDADVDARGTPPAVAELKDRIAAADGLLLASPEYNYSVPGVLKNVVDWLSRPPGDIARVFGERPVGLIGASSGEGATRLGQVAWLPVLRGLGTRLWTGKMLFVGQAGKVFDAEGWLVDEALRERVRAYTAGFAAFVTEHCGAGRRAP